MEYKTLSRKDAILEIARYILTTEGHYRLTMRNLAEKSGMKLASLQYHFPTKTELVSALMEQSIGKYHRMILHLVRSIGTNEDSAAIGRLFSVYQDEQTKGVFEQLWALSVQETILKQQYEKLYADFWETISTEVGRFDATADAETKKSRAAIIISLLDGLETFFSADQLRQKVPAQLQNQVVMLIRSVAAGKS
ncbi:MAG: AcrR family transcriptional regulator [Cellvibrionaceae bacterium]|jgi:AcrR family transcriptional regulator